MSLLRLPLASLIRHSSLRALASAIPSSSSLFSSSSSSLFSSSSSSSDPPSGDVPIEQASDELVRDAIAAVKGGGVDAPEAPLPPISGYPENYDVSGMEYTGRANIDYADAFILYKMETDMANIYRLEQPDRN